MKTPVFIAMCAGMVTLVTPSAPISAQTLQQFSQQDFEQLMKSDPQLLEQVVNPDGSVNRAKLEEILRDRFNYRDNMQLPAYLDFENTPERLQNDLTPPDPRNDVRLQKRLEEERMKAYEAYKKRMKNNPHQ